MMKKCIGICGLEKDESEFEFRKDTQKYRNMCKICCKEQSKKYREEHKEEVIERRQKYYQENREEILQKSKDYYIENKEAVLEYHKEYYINNQDKIIEYRQENKLERYAYNKDYHEKNKERLREQSRQRAKEKQNDPNFRLNKSVSNMVRKNLKKLNLNKNGLATWKHLPYTPQQLKEHIENTWSLPKNLDENGNIWMSWENYGPSRKDQKTWQIDHKKPQSHPDCQYTSLNDPKFLVCWAIDNLQAMESFANIKKGNKY